MLLRRRYGYLDINANGAVKTLTPGIGGRKQFQRIGGRFFEVIADFFPVLSNVFLHSFRHFLLARFRTIQFLNVNMLDSILHVTIAVCIPGTLWRLGVRRNCNDRLSFLPRSAVRKMNALTVHLTFFQFQTSDLRTWNNSGSACST
jgi:hypothetical protein